MDDIERYEKMEKIVKKLRKLNNELNKMNFLLTDRYSTITIFDMELKDENNESGKPVQSI